MSALSGLDTRPRAGCLAVTPSGGPGGQSVQCQCGALLQQRAAAGGLLPQHQSVACSDIGRKLPASAALMPSSVHGHLEPRTGYSRDGRLRIPAWRHLRPPSTAPPPPPPSPPPKALVQRGCGGWYRRTAHRDFIDFTNHGWCGWCERRGRGCE